MAGNYAQLLDIINNPTQHGLPAWDNNAKQIEGETVQQYLLTIINSLTVGYQFMGVASTNTDGGTPDQNVFYIAGAGTYNGFGSNPITINAGYIGIIRWNGAWSSDTIKIADTVSVSQNIETGENVINIGDKKYLIVSLTTNLGSRDIAEAITDIDGKILEYRDLNGVIYKFTDVVLYKNLEVKGTIESPTIDNINNVISSIKNKHIELGARNLVWGIVDSNDKLIFTIDNELHATYFGTLTIEKGLEVEGPLNTNPKSLFGNMLLNKQDVGNDNIISCWWHYPLVSSATQSLKQLFFGFADKDGYSGVACCELSNKNPIVRKNRLKNHYPDEHNSVSTTILDDGRILAIYSYGHATNKYLYVRRSLKPYSIDEFETLAVINNTLGNVTYAQVFKRVGYWYIFYRSNLDAWSYVRSADLINWSLPKNLIVSANNHQYYLLFKPVSDEPNFLKIAMYSNPTYDDTNIRVGYVDFSTEKIYDNDGTQVGTLGTPVLSNSFGVIIPQPTGEFNRNRLFDLAITNLNVTKISYSHFSTGGNGYEAKYYIYNNGTNDYICDAGETAWPVLKKMQNGVTFIDGNTIIVARSSMDATGYEHIEKWIYDNGEWVLSAEIYKELKGDLHIRNFYPFVDINGKYLVWFRGKHEYYGGENELGNYFNTQVMIYDLVENMLVDL